MDRLRALAVLESCAGTMEKAQSLKYVPLGTFVDGSGTPLTLTSRTAATYMSSRYPTWALEGIGAIGVSQLSPHEFLDDLRSLIKDNPRSFHSRSQQWHIELAESLFRLTTDEKLLSIMQSIDLVPLQDGTWTSAQGKSIFFAKGESSLKIPSGIDVLVVDESVESDVSRRKFYVSLGAKAWEASEICRLIVRVHESPSFNAKALTAEQLISHAAFLYKASWQPPKDVTIWFATMQDERCLGRELYIAGNVAWQSPASRVFAKTQERFPVILNGYLEVFPSDIDWPHWLVKNLGLSMVPRLITPLIEPTPQAVLKTQVPIVPPLISPLLEPAGSNNLWADRQMQLMLLEQQTKKALREARQAQDTSNSILQSTGPWPATVYSESQPLGSVTSNPPVQSPPSESFGFSLGDDSALDNFDFDSFLNTDAVIADADFDSFSRSDIDISEERSALNHRAESAGVRTTDGMEGFQQQNDLPTGADVLAPDHKAQAIFDMSEEFLYMLRECQSSDVLDVLKDNWQHYSQWIGGVHMSWQSAEFLESCLQLRKKLGSWEVVSACGMRQLCETVLPAIDQQLDQSAGIPAVDVKDPRHTDWKLLDYFDVVLVANVQYYLRCLIATAEYGHTDIDHVAYMYEKIQSFYRGNEHVVQYV